MTAQFELVQKENTDTYHNGISGENKTEKRNKDVIYFMWTLCESLRNDRPIRKVFVLLCVIDYFPFGVAWWWYGCDVNLVKKYFPVNTNASSRSSSSCSHRTNFFGYFTADSSQWYSNNNPECRTEPMAEYNNFEKYENERFILLPIAHCSVTVL